MKSYRYWFVKFYFDIEVCGEKDNLKYSIAFKEEDKARQFYDLIKRTKAKRVRCNQSISKYDYDRNVIGWFYDDWAREEDNLALFYKEEIIPSSPCVKIL